MKGFFNGAPGTIRTCDLPLRRRLLYPAELRVRNFLNERKNRVQRPICQEKDGDYGHLSFINVTFFYMNKQINFKDMADLKAHLASHVPTLYHSSQTSSVIPFERLSGKLNADTVLGNLSGIKGEMAILDNGNLKVSGFVTWKEAKEFCLQNKRDIMTSPTEELAGVLSGVATSATGERSFGFSNLRSQVEKIVYLDFNGHECTLYKKKKLNLNFDLKKYHENFLPFEHFKNAPFPRLQFETDLMTGFEGQLGVIVEVELKTIPEGNVSYLFMTLPRWEENDGPHLEFFELVQTLRQKIFACEFIDANSIQYLPVEKRLGENEDIIFIETREEYLESVIEYLSKHLKLISPAQIFEIGASKCREFRVNIPRAIFEANGLAGVTKKGTDVQVRNSDFKKLFAIYREFTKQNIVYNLFGHFGDAHLHFNFMPSTTEEKDCEELFLGLYKQVKEMHGSPFAEHGIGLLKRPFIQDFYSENEREVFKKLKNQFDPYGQFFNEGFMSC
jgi:FAD/FMN-containing dehydrogenase